MILATAEQIRKADEMTIKGIGLPGMVLMENAAQGAVRVLKDAMGDPMDWDVAAFCGRGNNGGDGLAMLRILAGQGSVATAYLFCREADLKGDAAANLAVAKACGVQVVEIPDDAALEEYYEDMAGHEIYLDALLGTGLNSLVKGRFAEAIELLNGLDAPVLAVDIPSGLSADTGAVLGHAVEADFTATFGLTKLGLAIDGTEHVGELTCVDISIPPVVVADLQLDSHLLEEREVRLLLPERPDKGHKGTFGHLLVVGGSPGKTGAPCLAAWGGLRAGAGLVTAALPCDLNPIAEVKLTAAMTQPLPQTSQGNLAKAAGPVVLKMLGSRQAMVLGPGLSTEEETVELVRDLVLNCRIPTVLDADALNALAGDLENQGFGAAPHTVLTPHPGEAARLLGMTTEELLADRPKAARVLARKTGCVTVLKGARSLIADPAGDLWVNPTGNVLLASGGSGDVLSGVIGGLMAQGLSALDAACAGVYVHGLAADLAIEEYGSRGLAADELVDFLVMAFQALLSEDAQGDLEEL